MQVRAVLFRVTSNSGAVKCGRRWVDPLASEVHREKSKIESAPLRLATLKAWGANFNIPGLPVQRSRKRIVVPGGPLIQLAVGLFWFVVYALVLEYALLVIILRLAWAIFLTLSWGVALIMEALQTRRMPAKKV